MRSEIPDYEVEAIACRLYPTLLAFYESPEGQAAFEKWKQEQPGKPDKEK